MKQYIAVPGRTHIPGEPRIPDYEHGLRARLDQARMNQLMDVIDTYVARCKA